MVTTTAWPFAASAFASYWLDDPAVKPPPWIHTITGRRNRTGLGVNTLTNRQSSFVLPCPLGANTPGGWGHGLPKCVASRMPDQLAAGCGARKRSWPTGGAANGIPRNEREPAFTVPRTRPFAVRTTE